MGDLNNTLSIWQDPIIAMAATITATAVPVGKTLKEQAAKHFLETLRLSKEAGDNWLSSHDAARVIELFQTDKLIANFYLIFSKSPNDSVLCS
jgi:hypothetical protein